MRHDIEQDPRLLGGVIQHVQCGCAVQYNLDGRRTEALATVHNTAIVILTRNRLSYLSDLIQSIDSTAPRNISRHIIANNCEDETVEFLACHCSEWKVDALSSEDFPPISAGLRWLCEHRPHALPENMRSGKVGGYGPTQSIAWLRNRMLRVSGKRFVVCFDDDMLVKPGWLEYLFSVQNQLYVHAVINNFGAYLMDTNIVKLIGWFDERFLRSHGYEDNDFLARINEARLSWALGFNESHDWRTAEEGNPRGSGTGNDLFIHRYAKMNGGFSASKEELSAAERDPSHYGNWCWYKEKWSHTNTELGIQDRPPFKGYFLQRKVRGEPQWHSLEDNEAGKKTQNTPVSEIDHLERPSTATMTDRYSLLAHWCKEKDVLDAGCGFGYGTALINTLGSKSVSGADSDETALDFAKIHYARDTVSFHKADLLNLPEEFSGRFDTVICVEVFEHLHPSAIPQLIVSLLRVLRPGGTLLLTTPRRKTENWNGRGGTHLYEYSVKEFMDTLSSLHDACKIKFFGIQEFQVQNSPQWFSMWLDTLDDSATVMVGVLEAVQCAALDLEHLKSLIPTAERTPRISILISNRNTLEYLKLAVKSCREHLTRHDHEIIVFDDASTDGSEEWLQANAERYQLKWERNTGPERLGIVYVYDRLVELASSEMVLICHSDMFFSKDADACMLRAYRPRTVVTCTRIEPPLYNEEPVRISKDFGQSAESFREQEFLRFSERQKIPGRATEGIFAPILIRRMDFIGVGGHDKLFAPQSREDSDLFNRLKLAGYKFIQTWEAFCYHFSGKGSRRKESPGQDSQEWKETNFRNHRNFIRKWGTPVLHDRWLNPVIVDKRPITLVGLLGNEQHNVIAWLAHHEPFFDDIVLISDSCDGSAALAEKYIEHEGKNSSIFTPKKLTVIRNTLNNDYASARNLAQKHAKFDWVFHVDLDERLESRLLTNLQRLVGELESQGKICCGLPRANYLEGVLVNDIPRTEWTLEHLKKLNETSPEDGINVHNRDVQFRLIRRSVLFTRAVHEIPEPVLSAYESGQHGTIPITKEGWIIHVKTLKQQAQQDLRYRMICPENGPHLEWSPETVLASL